MKNLDQRRRWRRNEQMIGECVKNDFIFGSWICCATHFDKYTLTYQMNRRDVGRYLYLFMCHRIPWNFSSSYHFAQSSAHERKKKIVYRDVLCHKHRTIDVAHKRWSDSVNQAVLVSSAINLLAAAA